MARVAPFVLAVLAVIALGAAAATIDTATDEGLAGDGEGEGFGSPGFSFGGINTTAPSDGPPLLPDWVVRLLTLALFALAIVGFAAYLYEEGLTGLAKLAVAAVVIAAVVLGLSHLLENIQFGEQADSGLIGGSEPAFGTGGGGGGDGAAPRGAGADGRGSLPRRRRLPDGCARHLPLD